MCVSSNKSFCVPHATNPVFYIGGNVIEFINDWSHLGHVISTLGDDMHDIESRKFSHIGQMNNILCDFRNVDSNTKIRLVKAYCYCTSRDCNPGPFSQSRDFGIENP